MYGIFTYIYHKFKPNCVAKYASPMEHMGNEKHEQLRVGFSGKDQGKLDQSWDPGILLNMKQSWW